MKRIISFLAIAILLGSCCGRHQSNEYPSAQDSCAVVTPSSAETVVAEKELPAKPLSKEEDASGFVVLTDVVPDVILEIRYFSTYNFIGTRVDGYDEPIALMTRKGAEALKSVSEELKAAGYMLKVFDAYRPQSSVDHFIRWAKDPADTLMKQYFYPNIPKSQIFPLGYVASRSGHSRGSTIDLTLFDVKTQRDVDMGGTFDFFGGKSAFDYPVSAEQRRLRNLLRESMSRGGFRGIEGEWWHFTLRDEPYPDTYFTFPNRISSVR